MENVTLRELMGQQKSLSALKKQAGTDDFAAMPAERYAQLKALLLEKANGRA